MKNEKFANRQCTKRHGNILQDEPWQEPGGHYNDRERIPEKSLPYPTRDRRRTPPPDKR